MKAICDHLFFIILMSMNMMIPICSAAGKQPPITRSTSLPDRETLEELQFHLMSLNTWLVTPLGLANGLTPDFEPNCLLDAICLRKLGHITTLIALAAPESVIAKCKKLSPRSRRKTQFTQSMDEKNLHGKKN